MAQHVIVLALNRLLCKIRFKSWCMADVFRNAPEPIKKFHPSLLQLGPYRGYIHAKGIAIRKPIL